MSDEAPWEAAGDNFPQVQFSTYVDGDHWVIRANTGEDLANRSEEVAEHMERAQKAIASWKQIALANSVFTGDSSKRGSGGGSSARTEDTPPPSGGGDSAPRCKHGPMKDLAGKGYKSRWYCTLETDNWREKCKPRN